MRDRTQPGALPLRPLTAGELLDAAVVLLRLHGARLLALGFALAALEQAVLFKLRRLADVDSTFLPGTDRLGEFGTLILVSIATETAVIALLGGVAARKAPKALLGWAAPAQLRPRRLGTVTTVAVVAGIVCAASAWTFLTLPDRLQTSGLVLASLVTVVFWPFLYGPLGLAAPAAVLDELGPGRALRRSLRLSLRGGMRVVWLRTVGYIAWLVIRLGVGLGSMAVVELFFSSPSSTVDNLITGGAWLLVNTLAYPTLGCLDVALHLEARMRTEGLDLALRRSVARGVAADTALAVPR